MKMAKATPEDISIVREFFQMLEEILDYETYTPLNDKGEYEEPVEVLTTEKLGELVLGKLSEVTRSWSRVVYGCQTLIDNCCDPDADTLEWRPDIQKFLEEQSAKGGE